MGFEKISLNSRQLLQEINESENPSSLLCKKFDKASKIEKDELRSILRELIQKKLIDIKWADNKPYIVEVSNEGRLYEDQLADYENDNRVDRSITINIGDNNKISDSVIAGNVKEDGHQKNKNIIERHPVICNLLISLLVGFVLLFHFWEPIINFIEGLF